MFKCLNIDILSISISEIQYESYIIWYTRHIRNISFHRLGLCQEYVIMGFHTDFFFDCCKFSNYNVLHSVPHREFIFEN